MDKNTKKDIKVIKGENNDNNKLTVDDKITIKELEESIAKMKADKEAKCSSAKEQLIETLKVTVDKYRTATGTAEALRTLRFVVGDDEVNLTWANRLAWDMAIEADRICEKAEKLAYAEMDKLCDGFYEKEFKVSYPEDFDDSKWDAIEQEHCYKLAFEMMRIDLCRNVGPAAEDMVEFIKRVQDEIDKTGEKLKELKAKEA